jgi:rhodanese-related sulfurtransferase
MSKFLFQAAIIIGAGLITGLAFSLTSPVQLHLENPNAGLPALPPRAPTGRIDNPAATGATEHSGPTGPTARPVPTGQQPQTGVTGGTPAASNDLFVTVDAAKAIFDSQRAIFIDARPIADYLKGHIPNAMHLEKDVFNGPPPAKVLNYLPGMEVVVYCHGEMCTDSENVIKRLVALNKGIGPYRIIKEGFPGWVKAGHPSATGAEVGFE